MLERAREMWNESERLGEKKERVWRERGKKGEREREIYEWIQGMREKKKSWKEVKKNNYLEVEFLGQ
jgi:TRAP-type mannitol/chloroaromatic compound transport system substrate-binding protein